MPLDIMQVTSEAMWLTLLPPREPAAGLTDKSVDGRTIVTLGSIDALELPPGYTQLSALDCCDALGDQIGDLGQNGRFLVSGDCSAPASFVIAARAGILNLNWTPSLGERLMHIDVMPDLRPLATLLDRIVDDPTLVRLRLEDEGDLGAMVATWLLTYDDTVAHADWLSWVSGVERWRFLMRQQTYGYRRRGGRFVGRIAQFGQRFRGFLRWLCGAPPTLFEFLKEEGLAAERRRQEELATLRDIYRRGTETGPSPE